jgi:hypothetical protein
MPWIEVPEDVRLEITPGRRHSPGTSGTSHPIQGPEEYTITATWVQPTDTIATFEAIPPQVFQPSADD